MMDDRELYEQALHDERSARERTLLSALDAEKARVKELESLAPRIQCAECMARFAGKPSPTRERAEQAERERDKLRASIVALADKHEEAERSYEFGDDDPEHFSWHLTMAGELRALLEKT